MIVCMGLYGCKPEGNKMSKFHSIRIKNKSKNRIDRLDGHVNDFTSCSWDFVPNHMNLTKLSLLVLVGFGISTAHAQGIEQEILNYKEHPIQSEFVLKDDGALYFDGGSRVISPSNGNFVLDIDQDNRNKDKNIFFNGGYLQGNENTTQYFFTNNLNITADTKSSAYKDARAIVSKVLANDKSNKKGGAFVFLPSNLNISSSYVCEGVPNFENGNLSSVIAIELQDGGKVSFLDDIDIAEEYNAEHLLNNDRKNVIISASANQFDCDLSDEGKMLKNRGYSSYGVKNTLSEFSLHSDEFEIRSSNAALSSYGLDDSGQVASSISDGVFGQGGSFHFRIFEVRTEKL